MVKVRKKKRIMSTCISSAKLILSNLAPVKKTKFGKNPSVDTSFLPDRDREEQERQEREELRKEWLRKQEEIKQEDIEVTYSYWDGSGHRKSVVVSVLAFVVYFLRFHSLIRSALDHVNLDSVRKAILLALFWRNVEASSQNYEVSARTISCTSKQVEIRLRFTIAI